MISNFYSGFSLENEKELFKVYIIKNDFSVAGFSYGAINAFESVLKSSQRVDLLQLFSPAFFQDRDKTYKRMQLMFFKKDSSSYCKEFLENIAYPSTVNTQAYFKQGTSEELDELLNYEWSKEKLQQLLDKGTKIEVYLGKEDKIINSLQAKDFFVNYATVYFTKNMGHILN